MSKHFDYNTRPAKHIERRLFIETLHHLSNVGYPIHEYHYIGFGSHYFVDFLMFHKYLYIGKMTCFEKKLNKKKRMNFNKPYEFIDLICKKFWVDPKIIKNDEKYFIWLDYECHLDGDMLRDIGLLAGKLMAGSILIVTVNAEYDDDNDDGDGKKTAEDFLEEYEAAFGEHTSFDKRDMNQRDLPKAFSRTIMSKITSQIASSRSNNRFLRLFNFKYADGVQMLTFGGVIDTKAKIKKARKATLKLNYISMSKEPVSIEVPSLTYKEKNWIDTEHKKGLRITSMPFELNRNEMKYYKKFSIHYPLFREVTM